MRHAAVAVEGADREIAEYLRVADAARIRGDYDAAVRAFDRAHILGHDMPLVHLRVHLAWFRAAIAAGRIGTATGQVLPILFAVPVSLAQRHLGFSRTLRG